MPSEYLRYSKVGLLLLSVVKFADLGKVACLDPHIWSSLECAVLDEG